jgi:creatinine amidohydrolase
MKYLSAPLALLVFLMVYCQKVNSQNNQPEVSTRKMNDINWMEFGKFVPSRINTVLLPTGTLEPHGVINNGADNDAPEAMAMDLAEELNALVAPTLPYGMTGSLAAYPGAFTISEAAYRPFIKEILEGLVKNGFKNIIILNGHGGGQTDVLSSVATEVANENNVRTLVINWWSFASDVTLEVFGEDGGHAGLNETAFIQAINPDLVHKDLYNNDMTTAYPKKGTWAATPFPSSIGLYKEDEGYPDFDQKKADEYYEKVVDKVGNLISETIAKWEMAFGK